MNGHPPIKLLFLFILVYSIVFYMYMALQDLNQVLPEVWLTASSWSDAGVVPFFNDSLSVYPSYMIQGEELKETAAYRIGAANRLRWSFPQSMEIITGMFWQKKPVLWILSLARIWCVYTQTSVARNLGNQIRAMHTSVIKSPEWSIRPPGHMESWTQNKPQKLGSDD